MRAADGDPVMYRLLVGVCIVALVMIVFYIGFEAGRTADLKRVGICQTEAIAALRAGHIMSDESTCMILQLVRP